MSKYNWGAIKERAVEGGFDPNPLGDGKYPLGIVKAANFMENNNHARFGFLLSVVGGPDDGRTVWANLRVPTGKEAKAAATAAMFLKALTGLGVNLSDNDPEGDAKKAVGNYVSFEVKTNDAGFQNVNNIRKATGPESTGPEAVAPIIDSGAPSTVDDGDEPF